MAYGYGDASGLPILLVAPLVGCMLMTPVAWAFDKVGIKETERRSFFVCTFLTVLCMSVVTAFIADDALAGFYRVWHQLFWEVVIFGGYALFAGAFVLIVGGGALAAKVVLARVWPIRRKRNSN